MIMKKLNPLIVFFLLIPFLMNQCNISTANLTDVKMCDQLTASECEEDMITFTNSTTAFYVSCHLNNAPAATEVTFSWYYYGDEKILIDEVTMVSEDTGTSFIMSSNLSIPDNGWTVGNYEVSVKINTDNAEPVVKAFKVE